MTAITTSNQSPYPVLWDRPARELAKTQSVPRIARLDCDRRSE